MIIGSYIELPLQEVILASLTDGRGVMQDPQILVVMRQASYQEYVEELESDGWPGLDYPTEWEACFYYEVSMD